MHGGEGGGGVVRYNKRNMIPLLGGSYDFLPLVSIVILGLRHRVKMLIKG